VIAPGKDRPCRHRHSRRVRRRPRTIPTPPAGSRTHSGSAVEVNLCTPIAVAVQGWCGDAVAVVAVDGEVDADSLRGARHGRGASRPDLPGDDHRPDPRPGAVRRRVALPGLRRAGAGRAAGAAPASLAGDAAARRSAGTDWRSAPDDTLGHRKPVSGQTGLPAGLTSSDPLARALSRTVRAAPSRGRCRTHHLSNPTPGAQRDTQTRRHDDTWRGSWV
jgi:hypothetical protein